MVASPARRLVVAIAAIGVPLAMAVVALNFGHVAATIRAPGLAAHDPVRYDQAPRSSEAITLYMPYSVRNFGLPGIRGVVSTFNGVPLAGITVKAYRLNTDLGNGVWQLVETTTSGPRGRYILGGPAGTYRLGFLDFRPGVTARFASQYYLGGVDVEDATDILLGKKGLVEVDATLQPIVPIADVSSNSGLVSVDSQGLSTIWRTRQVETNDQVTITFTVPCTDVSNVELWTNDAKVPEVSSERLQDGSFRWTNVPVAALQLGRISVHWLCEERTRVDVVLSKIRQYRHLGNVSLVDPGGRATESIGSNGGVAGRARLFYVDTLAPGDGSTAGECYTENTIPSVSVTPTATPVGYRPVGPQWSGKYYGIATPLANEGTFTSAYIDTMDGNFMLKAEAGHCYFVEFEPDLQRYPPVRSPILGVALGATDEITDLDVVYFPTATPPSPNP